MQAQHTTGDVGREGPLEILCSLCLAKNCAKGRSKEAMQINRDLDNIKAQIIKHYQHLSDREAFVTAEMVRNSYQGFGSEYETLLNAFDKDIASLKKRVGKDRVASTLCAMQRSRKDVADFLQSNLRRTDISMLELAPEFIKDFAAYLSTDRGLANGTILQRCLTLRIPSMTLSRKSSEDGCRRRKRNVDRDYKGNGHSTGKLDKQGSVTGTLLPKVAQHYLCEI